VSVRPSLSTKSQNLLLLVTNYFARAKLAAICPRACLPERNGPQSRWLPHSKSDTGVICKLGFALAYRPTPAYDGNASCAHTIDSDPYHSRTGGLNDVERKARSEAQARGESGTGTRGCRFVVAGGWCLGRDKRSAGGGPASSNDHAESRDHPRRGRAFRRQPVDLLCLRQRERQVSAW
jgi:hypothetical protein